MNTHALTMSSLPLPSLWSLPLKITTRLKKHTAVILFILSSLCATPALADTDPQNNPLGGLLGALANGVMTLAKNHADHANGGNASSTPSSSSSTSSSSTANTTAHDFIQSLRSNITVPMSDADKQLMANGMWRDPQTGLVWMRCLVGETFSASGCSREGVTFLGTTNWFKALAVVKDLNYGGYNDWRLPTAEELYGLERCRDFSREMREANKVSIPLNNGGIKEVSADPFCNDNDHPYEKSPIDSSTPLLSNPSIFPDNEGGTMGTGHARIQLWSTSVDSYYGAEYGALSGHIMRVWQGSPLGITDTRINGMAPNGIRAVRSDRPSPIFEKAFAESKSDIDKALQEEKTLAENTARNKASYDNMLKARDAENRQNAIAYNNRVAAFRSSVKEGDSTSEGLVIQIKGNLILIQQSGRQCLKMFYDTAYPHCSQYGPVMATGEKWVNRNAVLPVR